jgi:mannose-6-phosphate isomerase-like protein (cupin superfamily)
LPLRSIPDRLLDRNQPRPVVGLVDHLGGQDDLLRHGFLLEAHVARHKHQVQEQIYHVLEGEGLMEIAGKNHVVRRHDFIFLPPGVEHAISNSGLPDLVFLVITSPVTDDEKPL